MRAADWWVGPVSPVTGRELIREYHYARKVGAGAIYVHGLWERGDFMDANCMGVAWWAVPPSQTSAQATYPVNWKGVLVLSRLVVVPGVPRNACSFLMAKSRRLIDRKRWPCLASYADTYEGHTGAIYRADNWHYVGITKAERMYRLNGRLVTRKHFGGCRTNAEMVARGCEVHVSPGKHKFIHVERVA